MKMITEIKYFLVTLIGFLIFFVIFTFMYNFFEEKHSTQFELCEKEARSIYLETFQIDTSHLTIMAE